MSDVPSTEASNATLRFYVGAGLPSRGQRGMRVRIHIDDRPAGHVETGAMLRCPVAAGHHTVRADVLRGVLRSRSLSVTVGPHDVATIHVRVPVSLMTMGGDGILLEHIHGGERPPQRA